MSELMTIHLKYWKQNGANSKGYFEEYSLKNEFEFVELKQRSYK
ncbi:MAG: hypothetical protein WD059_03235 [Balneolaceae bacterium]